MLAQTISTGATKTPGDVRTPGWRRRAVEKYEGSLPIRRERLRVDLAARLPALTGRPLSPQDVNASPEGRLAVADVEGAVFRLWRRSGEARSLVLARPCAYCGTGRFESPEITTTEDLGRALSAWRPLHVDCEDDPPEDLPDF